MSNMKPEIKRKYYDNGQLDCEEYTVNGIRHREDGPAYRYWYKNGQLEGEVYCVSSLMHREDGPAYRYWYKNGQLVSEEYWLNGTKLTKSEFYRCALDAGKISKAEYIAEVV